MSSNRLPAVAYSARRHAIAPEPWIHLLGIGSRGDAVLAGDLHRPGHRGADHSAGTLGSPHPGDPGHRDLQLQRLDANAALARATILESTNASRPESKSQRGKPSRGQCHRRRRACESCALHDSGMLATWQSFDADPPSYRVRDGLGQLDLKLSRGHGFPGFWPMNPFSRGADSAGASAASQVSVQLSTGIPLEIQAQLGASEATIDLRELQVNQLMVDPGASNGTIYLPSLAESTSATIQGGASNLEIVVPDGLRTRSCRRAGLAHSTLIRRNSVRPKATPTSISLCRQSLERITSI